MPSIDAVSSGRRRPLRPRSGSGPGRNTAPRAGRRSPVPEAVAPGLHVGRPVGPAAPCRRALRRRAFRPWVVARACAWGEVRVVTAGASASGRRVRCRSRRSGRRTTPTFGCAARWRGRDGAAQVLVVHQPAHLGVPGDQPGLVADRGGTCGSGLGLQIAQLFRRPQWVVLTEAATGRARSCIEARDDRAAEGSIFELSVSFLAEAGAVKSGRPVAGCPPRSDYVRTSRDSL